MKIALLSVSLFLGLALIPAFGGLPGSEGAPKGAPRWQAAPQVAATAEPGQCLRFLRKVGTQRGERARYRTVCGGAADLLLSDIGDIPMPPLRPGR